MRLTIDKWSIKALEFCQKWTTLKNTDHCTIGLGYSIFLTIIESRTVRHTGLTPLPFVASDLQV